MLICHPKDHWIFLRYYRKPAFRHCGLAESPRQTH
jgi:hypothetical protein